MARVTVEDCEKVVPNKFDLVIFASQRVRQLSAGAQSSIEKTNDKPVVVALREIAERTVNVSDLEEAIVRSLQTYLPVDDIGEDEDVIDQDDTYAPSCALENATNPVSRRVRRIQEDYDEVDETDSPDEIEDSDDLVCMPESEGLQEVDDEDLFEEQDELVE